MNNEAHVIPIGDLIEHEVTEDCPCGPSPRLVDCAGGDGWLIVHASLDGREERERKNAAEEAG